MRDSHALLNLVVMFRHIDYRCIEGSFFRDAKMSYRGCAMPVITCEARSLKCEPQIMTGTSIFGLSTKSANAHAGCTVSGLVLANACDPCNGQWDVKKGEVNSSASFVSIAFLCLTGYFQSSHPTTVTSLVVTRLTLPPMPSSLLRTS